MASADITTPLSDSPRFSTARALDERRERRQIARKAASLIDSYDEHNHVGYIESWARIASKRNLNAIADAVEQFTPEEIAEFIVALVQKAVEW